MAEDWAPGDLALCVKGGYITSSGAWKLPDNYPQTGSIYPVLDVIPDLKWVGQDLPGLGLVIDGPKNEGPSGTGAWFHGRFIKVTPTEEDEFDKEIIALYQMEPEPVTGRANALKGF